MAYRICTCILLLLLSFPAAGLATQPIALKLGVLPAADTIVLHVAAEEGLFAKQGLNVELVPFQSALEIGSAMRGKALDGHFGDIINVLAQHTSGAPQAIVATTSRSSATQRYFGLVVSPKAGKSQARSLEDLRGGTVAASSASIIDYLLDVLLARKELGNDFMQRQEIRQIPVRMQMLMSGQLDAALLPEPLVSLMEAKGAHTVLDDRELRVPLAVVAVSRATLQQHPALPGLLRTALVQAAQRINANPEIYKTFMVQKKLLPADAAPSYHMITFDLEYTPAGLPSPAEIEAFASWMRGKGMLKGEFVTEELAR